MDYYNGDRLLSKLDISGQPPQFYICTTNRTAGKTTYFNSLVLREFLAKSKKFALLYRYDYELPQCSDKFFKDIHGLFFPAHCMTDKSVGKNVMREIYVGEAASQDDPEKLDSAAMSPCGYALAINKADQIKKYSHFLSDVETIIFDEFQSETGNYCPNEIQKFLSILTSICRGQGETFRYVRVILIGNQVTILNPYFIEMGISERLQNETKFLRGDGWVLENGFNIGASESIKNSPLARAFKNNKYIAYSAENVYLNDTATFIEPPPSVHGKYLATIKMDGDLFGLIEYADQGIIYCKPGGDPSYPYKISVSDADHDINYVMIERNHVFISSLRFFFEKGCFRFKNAKSKRAVLALLSY